MSNKFRTLLFGKPRNPMQPATRKHIALIAFLAWIGLGADGLSSSCYGPQEAFLALGQHTHLALYLAILTGFTVFLISLAYNQVIRLFPNGGGGYKVATELLGDYAGLVSGSALIIDYFLTIAISIASGTDAVFSLLPIHWQQYKLTTEVVVLAIMVFLNLRGAKESIKILMPIFLGFFITHLFMIVLGISLHGKNLPALAHATTSNAHNFIKDVGWIVALAFFMRAYSLGAGTYTGIEAVSNNVNILAEPRVRTGRWTMFYMALSLSVTAGGIILLYLLWNAHPVAGKTLNAVVFSHILGHWHFANSGLLILMIFEAGILFVAANTGFLGGPAVLANMSVDKWVPKRFSALSSRLVTQNGILLFGLAAFIILIGSDGNVSFLVVLYSMNVFLTFSMSFLGLINYWRKQSGSNHWWLINLCFATLALLLCAAILLVTLVEKFELGGWITVVVTSAVIIGCYFIRSHYQKMSQLKRKLDQELQIPLPKKDLITPKLDPQQPTAVFFVKRIGAAMHSLLWVHRMFPNHFKNIIFVTQGIVDINSFGSDRKLEKLQKDTNRVLDYLVKFSQHQGYAADSYETFGTDPVEDILKISQEIDEKYSNVIYFSSRYVYPNENWLTRVLHGDVATIIQKRLHAIGAKMLVLPLNLKI